MRPTLRWNDQLQLWGGFVTSIDGSLTIFFAPGRSTLMIGFLAIVVGLLGEFAVTRRVRRPVR